MSKLLSLCIPTYGVSEWVFPVLDSIYNQKVDDELFEVVLTDNGTNQEFENKMSEYCANHKNLVYKKTNAYSFLNEIESYKLASGEFIKFINHRSILLEGALQYFIDFVKNNIEEKPFVYFTTGALNMKQNSICVENFDKFVKYLSYWSSCSIGMAFWKKDFDSIKKLNIDSFNELFPHTDILFSQKNKSKYIIDNTKLLEEINVDDTKKGKYDLFYAFAVEYPSIILDLYRKKYISFDTFESVKNDNLSFVSTLYRVHVKKKRKCSYDLSSFEKSIRVFYSKKEVKRNIRRRIIKKLLNRR